MKVDKSNGINIFNQNVMMTKVLVIFPYRILVKFGDIRRSYYISTFYESLNLTFKSSTISIEILAFLPAKIADITNNVKGQLLLQRKISSHWHISTRFQVVSRGGCRTAATSKMEHFVIIVSSSTVNYYCKLSQSAPFWMLQQPWMHLWSAYYVYKGVRIIHFGNF